MASLRLASFKTGGRESYGAVTEQGIVDLGRRLTKYATLRDVLRAQAVGEARAAASGPADYALKDVIMLPPIPEPGKNICVGINYPDRSAEYKDGREAPKYPNLFCRFPTSLVGTEQPIVRPKVSDKFDYEGEIVLVIGKEGRHVPRESALERIEAPELKSFLAPLDVEIARARSNEGNIFSSTGREIWHDLAIALVVLLVFESIFATWVGRSR